MQTAAVVMGLAAGVFMVLLSGLTLWMAYGDTAPPFESVKARVLDAYGNERYAFRPGEVLQIRRDFCVDRTTPVEVGRELRNIVTVVDDFMVRSMLEQGPAPGEDLSGPYSFVDSSTGSANTSFLNVDTAGGRLCVAGEVKGNDGPANVRFSYESLGSIGQANGQRVRGDFTSLRLMLDITGGTSPAYGRAIEATCRLKASLQKAGALDKVRLRCDLGE